jgi:hypothetical protein
MAVLDIRLLEALVSRLALLTLTHPLKLYVTVLIVGLYEPIGDVRVAKQPSKQWFIFAVASQFAACT